MSTNPNLNEEEYDFGEEEEEEVEEAAPTPPPAPETSGPKGLRQEKDRWKKEAIALRSQVMSNHLSQIGLSHEHGLGKAIAKEYTGDFTLEAITAYAAEEYQYNPATSPPPPPAVGTADRIEALNQSSAVVEPPPVVNQAEEAAAKMHDPDSGADEAVASLNAKWDQFARTHYPEQVPQQQ